MNENTGMTFTPSDLEWFGTMSLEIQRKIIWLMNDGGCAFRDIKSLISEDGVEAFVDCWVVWCQLEQSGASTSSLAAFVKLFGLGDIGGFEVAYVGQYDSEAIFAEEWMEGMYSSNNFAEVVVDWKATWDTNLRHDFFYTEAGHVFFRNW